MVSNAPFNEKNKELKKNCTLYRKNAHIYLEKFALYTPLVRTDYKVNDLAFADDVVLLENDSTQAQRQL